MSKLVDKSMEKLITYTLVIFEMVFIVCVGFRGNISEKYSPGILYINGDRNVDRFKRKGNDDNQTNTKFMAIIFKDGHVFVCAGTLISPYHVLTAAHCVISNRSVRISPHRFSVRFGHKMISLDMENHQVIMWFAHPNYQRGRREYDVAVLELARKVTLSETLTTVKLPRDSYKYLVDSLIQERSLCVILGWQSDLNKHKNAKLNKYYLDYSFVNLVPCSYNVNGSLLICSKLVNQPNRCRGDSGGPLICIGGGQFGVATWKTGCGKTSPLEIFTRIDSVFKFIIEASERQGQFFLKENTASKVKLSKNKLKFVVHGEEPIISKQKSIENNDQKVNIEVIYKNLKTTVKFGEIKTHNTTMPFVTKPKFPIAKIRSKSSERSKSQDTSCVRQVVSISSAVLLLCVLVQFVNLM